MSSAGGALGGIAGAGIGLMLGGPMGAIQGFSVGNAIGTMIDPPKLPAVIGPKLSDLTIQTSTYGAPIPRTYGTITVVGNIFYLENNKLKQTANTTTQGGKGGGGGGQSTTTYSYSATFAVGLCEGEIGGVRRIWANSTLIYDVSGIAAPPATVGGAFGKPINSILQSRKAKSNGQIAIYTGSETQSPDPRMAAALGIDNTPAYRGLAYIMFSDFQLANYGNSLMGVQIKVEICGRGQGETLYTTSSWTNPSALTDLLNDVAWQNVNDGTIYTSGSTKTIKELLNQYSSSSYGRQDSLTPHVIPPPTSTSSLIGYIYNLDFSQRIPVYRTISSSSRETTTSTWAASNTFATFTNAQTGNQPPPPYYIPPATFDVLVTGATSSDALYNFGVLAETKTASLNITRVYYSPSIGYLDCFGAKFFSGGGFAPYDSVVASSAGAVDNIPLTYTTLGVTVPVFTTVYTLWTTAIDRYTVGAVETGTWTPAKFIGTSVVGGVRLSDIIKSECLGSKLLTSGDLDVSQLTQLVNGFKVSNVAAIRGGIDPLQAAFPFDVIQSGYTIRFKPRGVSSPVLTLGELDLDARGSGQNAGVRLTIDREMDLVLPKKVTIKHFDPNRFYDVNEQGFSRLNTDSVNIRALDLPIVFSASEALNRAEMLLYLAWMERYDFKFNISGIYDYLEPADIITITTASQSFVLRLTSVNYTSDRRVECIAKLNSSAIYMPAAVGEVIQSPFVQLAPAGATVIELLDIPATTDLSGQGAGFDMVMHGESGASWTSGTVYVSQDSGVTWQTAHSSSMAAQGSVGVCSGTLSAKTVQECGVFDQSGVLNVTMTVGTLASVTDEQLFNNANLFAYGADGRWEILSVRTCTLVSAGVYTLTTFIRGRCGTEWATGLHQEGDKLIALDMASAFFFTRSSSEIGLLRTYKPVTTGELMSTGVDVPFTYRGVNLKPLSPVSLNGWRDQTTGDFNLSWVRRTRFGGELRDNVDVPLNEASELYEVEICTAGFASVMRTISTSVPNLLYTSAQQVADFGANQTTIYARIYQISAVVGRGYPLEASITR